MNQVADNRLEDGGGCVRGPARGLRPVELDKDDELRVVGREETGEGGDGVFVLVAFLQGDFSGSGFAGDGVAGNWALGVSFTV